MKPSRPGAYKGIPENSEDRAPGVVRQRGKLQARGVRLRRGAYAPQQKIGKIVFATIVGAAMATGCAGEEGSPDRPATPTSQVPGPTKPESSPTAEDSTPSPQRTTQEPERSLPAECRHPAGASVRESCIEEYGPEGVGTVEPVQPPPEETGDVPPSDTTENVPSPEETEDVPTPEQTDDTPSVPSTEEQIEQCTEQTGEPEACREKIDP